MTLVLKPNEHFTGPRYGKALGPCLQGVLMEHVDKDYAAMLHSLPFNPYSQYCYWEEGNLVWKVNALTCEAMTHVVEPLRGLDSVAIKAVHTSFEVVKTSQETIGLKSLLGIVSEPSGSKVRVRFVTPTSFKSQGSYVIMPSVRLVLQNLRSSDPLSSVSS